MAVFFKDDKTANEYKNLFEKGKTWVNENLFNGEYYYQIIDLNDKSILSKFGEGEGWDTYRGGRSKKGNYWDEESKTIRYQVAEGCLIDQVVAQWHANLFGLGDIFDQKKRVKALEAIYKNNFIKNMRSWVNPCRVYALNDEAATIICSFPKSKPAVPVPYSEEAMNGFEYQVACHMIQEGMVTEGIEIVSAVRDRYDGEKRNPWNEFECGSNYVRSMASYAFLPTFSGFAYDGRNQSIGFSPVNVDPVGGYYTFWSANTSWGAFKIRKNFASFKVLYDKISLRQFSINVRRISNVFKVTLDKQPIEFLQNDNNIEFKDSVSIKENQELKLFF